jgi:hypothetical protein
MRTALLALCLAVLPFAARSIGAGPGAQDPKPVSAPQEAARPAAPELGKPAPAFRVNDHAGNAVAVGGEAEHWTVLAFYPKASTPG